METKFFDEGDELAEVATGLASDDGWDEPTLSVSRRRNPRGLVSWAAVATTAALVSAVLAFRLASRPPIPSRAVAAEAAQPLAETRTVTAATTATVAPVPEQTVPVPAAGSSDSPELLLPSHISPPHPAAGTPDAQPVVANAPAGSPSFAACRSARAGRHGQKVLAECRRAFSEDPTSAEIALILAKTEFERARFRPALDWAKKAVALDDQQADAYVFLGGAEQAAGHRAAAKSAYQRYLQLAPKGRYAAELRAVLGSL